MHRTHISLSIFHMHVELAAPKLRNFGTYTLELESWVKINIQQRAQTAHTAFTEHSIFPRITW